MKSTNRDDYISLNLRVLRAFVVQIQVFARH
jgi:hypothetical protein